jgi:hypothetical protein
MTAVAQDEQGRQVKAHAVQGGGLQLHVREWGAAVRT